MMRTFVIDEYVDNRMVSRVTATSDDKFWWCEVEKKRMPGAEHRTVHCHTMRATDGSHIECGWRVMFPIEVEDE